SISTPPSLHDALPIYFPGESAPRGDHHRRGRRQSLPSQGEERHASSPLPLHHGAIRVLKDLQVPQAGTLTVEVRAGTYSPLTTRSEEHTSELQSRGHI